MKNQHPTKLQSYALVRLAKILEAKGYFINRNELDHGSFSVMTDMPLTPYQLRQAVDLVLWEYEGTHVYSHMAANLSSVIVTTQEF